MKLSPLTRYLTYQLYHTLHLIFHIVSDGESTDIHHFRIAIRRTRSLLHLYPDSKNGFPPLLKEAVRQTNILREIDVLLLSVSPKEYPKTFKRLRNLREEHYRSIFTERFKQEVVQTLHRYYDDLCKNNRDIGPEQSVAIAEAYYKECQEAYLALPENASQKELHALRIKFKNGRYGLEFINESSLADEEEKISACKTYQNILGSIQDTYNQIKLLKKIDAQYPCEETADLIRKRKKRLKKLKKARVSNQSA